MRRAWMSCFALSLLLGPSLASAQPNRGTIVVHPPTYVPKGTTLTVEVDGRPVPAQTMNAPLLVTPGRKHVDAYIRDAAGQLLRPADSQMALVQTGGVTHVTIPEPVYGPKTGLLAGGIAVSTLGVIFLIGSGILFSVADGAGSDCHEGGFAVDACGADPGPFLGVGATALLFGLAGIIGGPVMIAEGAARRVSWVVPKIEVGPGWASLGWRF